MEFKYSKNKIVINNKVITKLDRFVLDFISILDKFTEYVIVSEYVPIFFGRTNGTEDIDTIIKHFDKDIFTQLFNTLEKKDITF